MPWSGPHSDGKTRQVQSDSFAFIGAWMACSLVVIPSDLLTKARTYGVSGAWAFQMHSLVVRERSLKNERCDGRSVWH